MRRELETKATTAATGYIDNGVCIIGVTLSFSPKSNKMCTLRLYLCPQHDYSVHGVKIFRCRAAIANGFPRMSNIIWIRTLHLAQDEGCNGFEFSMAPQIIAACPFLDAEEDRE
ncbi:hypothetical protein MGN70_014383 [Eutypa lata]|nr:hypothetical protein MGN70_014383 [Eutypa lata]